MKKWNLIIDIAQCHDCNNCFLACKDEFFENDFPPYSFAQPRHGHRWIDIQRQERGQFPKTEVSYLPIPCMHCDDAPCITETEDDAVYKRDDGIVLIDPEKAKGRKDILGTCPYGVIWWNEEKDIPQKCTFCIHLLEDGWETPRCVQACPTGAMQIIHVEDSEMGALMQSEKLEVYEPQYQTSPRVYYKSLYLYTKFFIAGSVALKVLDECAEGAKVRIKDSSGKIIGNTETNNFGDFKYDALEKGKYSLEIEFSEHPLKELSLDLTESTNIGTVYL